MRDRFAYHWSYPRNWVFGFTIEPEGYFYFHFLFLSVMFHAGRAH